MSKAAFDRIAEGLREALSVARSQIGADDGPPQAGTRTEPASGLQNVQAVGCDDIGGSRFGHGAPTFHMPQTKTMS